MLRLFEEPSHVPTLVSVALFAGIAAGVYPALILSGFQPVSVLKGVCHTGKGALLRKGLVVFQFALSTVLITGTILVYEQLQYMKDKKLGLNKEQVVLFRIGYPGVREQMPAMKRAFLQHPGIVKVGYFDDAPTRRYKRSVELRSEGEKEFILMRRLDVGVDFLDMMEIDLIAGRTFSADRISDRTETLIFNEKAVARLEFSSPEDAIGRRLASPGGIERTLIGVVQDFHFESLHHPIQPMAIVSTGSPTEVEYSFVGARIRPENMEETLRFMEETWRHFIPQMPLGYWFLDEDFASVYRSEERMGQILGVFALLAVSIACLGVFALAAFAAEQRTREIGIRKALGASASSIVVLLSKEFAKLVMLAIGVAWPLAYYAISRWLQNFAYRIDLSSMAFLVGGIVSLVIALATVSYQVFRAAQANPVDALQYE